MRSTIPLRSAASRGLLTGAVLTMGSLGLSACATSGPAYEPVSTDVAAIVSATNGLNFEPKVVRIRVGETVEWRNTSLFSHTVTDDPENAGGKRKAYASLPAGAVPFDAKLPAGQVFRHTFTVPGTYRYFCKPHEAFDMRGEIIVVN